MATRKNYRRVRTVRRHNNRKRRSQRGGKMGIGTMFRKLIDPKYNKSGRVNVYRADNIKNRGKSMESISYQPNISEFVTTPFHKK